MIIGSLVAIVIAAVLLALVVRVAARNPDVANLGARTLAFQADRLSKEIAERGPVIFKDPLQRGSADNDLFVQHVGTDPDKGWVAVRAYAGEAKTECLLRWQQDANEFRDPCTGTAYPAEGTGLRAYSVSVAEGVVRVSIRADAAAQPTN
jgi:hypothetical protein